MWGTREIANSDVRGFRTLDKKIEIYPTSNSLSSKIAIRDYSSIKNNGELLKEISQKYTDLDKQNYESDLSEIAKYNELGINEEERLAKLETFKRIALIYNCGGILVFVFMMIFSDFLLRSEPAEALIALYPLAGLLLLVFGKGLIKLVYGRQSPYGSVVVGMYCSVIVLLIAVVVHYQFITYKSLLLPGIIAALVIAGVMFKYGYNKSTNASKGQIIILFLLSLFYAFPLTMLVNCQVDRSVPAIYVSKILSRNITHGNGRNYCHITIAAWDDQTPLPKQMQIDNDLFNRLESEQSVHVNVKRGLFNIPWYYVTE